MPVPTTRAHLAALDLLRGLAALSVMLFHIGGKAFENLLGHRPVGDALAFGYAGLDFFFVLSGFIILHVHRGDIGHPRRLAFYAWNRLARVFPPYWIVTLVYASLALTSGLEIGADRLVSSMLLWPGLPPLLGVAWTLSHELLFYAVFAIVIAAPRLGLSLAFFWILGSFLVPAGISPVLDFLFNIRHFEFLVGAAAAWGLGRMPLSRPIAFAGAGAAVFAAAALLDVWQAPLPATAFILAYGLASGVIIFGLARADMAGLLRVPASLRLVGEASYAIYLTHLLGFSLTARAAMMLGLQSLIPGWALLLLLAVVITLGGILFHLWVELPLLRHCRTLRNALLKPLPETSQSWPAASLSRGNRALRPAAAPQRAA
ncbi:acyltransferase [Roseomonas sp. SSH11]|uniref:Acyltransferase n=1 Tax=Pararoseomonas baculiformis TaxID=2820812 RepID=A0ABS4AHF5_9PROT|nr:acyltransferase [Pararoseomonas baculiformis]MBP0446451.1 acyltransferase [Pararoseomonas baculiformis]